MKNLFLIACVVCLLSATALSQVKSNDTVSQQIRRLGSSKTFTLVFDDSGNNSKLMGVSENFSDADAGSAGVRAMNFAAGFFYAGDGIAEAPREIMLTFWVLTKKPRFAENHHLTVRTASETIDIGDARYSPKPRSDMEYLNFVISRDALARIAGGSNVRFRLGDHDFTFTRSQMKLLADLLLLSDPKYKQ